MAEFSLNQWIFVIACVVQVVSGETIVCLRKHNEQCIQGVDKITSLFTNYEAFLGIPFAKPPVGQLRFANPVPADLWHGIYDATQVKPDCIQRSEFSPQQGDIIGSEDCLYLNVYRPKNASNHLPVLVYIHGGDFQAGSVSPTLSGPDRFMISRDAILVTVSYRLGALGFLSTGDSIAPGNFGLKDQSMAIRWVRKHIRKFGGDSHLITIFGEGAGGAAAQYHMMSPLSRGNFSRAILMSGSALVNYGPPRTNALQIARIQAGVLGKTPYDALTSEEVITFLRSITAEQLVGSFDDVIKLIPISNILTIYRPVIEQYVEGQSFIHESPLKLWAEGNYEQIPWMTGHVPNEGIITSRLLLKFISDPTLWVSLLLQVPTLITEGFGVQLSKGFQLVHHYFGNIDITSVIDLSPRTIMDLGIIPFSDVLFKYPMMKSVTQHVQRANPLKAPVSVYFMNFTGLYTLAPLLIPESTLSIGFSDDLQYVLNRQALFPDFPFASPGYLMSKKMVKMFVDFARTGHALSSYLGTCPSTSHCQQIEITNDDGIDPVKIELTNAIDFDLLNFLDGEFSSS